ncbi:MAG: 2-oxo acid dehydrogenase subunit E2 [Oscillospiraceae bacterium]|nr:2-oxo acid dehydrogenase subunit E2 [Oscillospiraceae bacterium]
MALLVRMPQKGLSEESAILSQWYVKEGDVVKKGDSLFAIETGKATFDIESEADGTVLKTIGADGDEIAVKAVVCVIGQPGESYELDGETAPAAAPAPAAPAAAPAPAAPAAVGAAEDEGDACFIRMPQKGLSEESAILSQWYVKKGDTVKKGDNLFAIETGKATFDIESETDGTVLETIGEAGDEIAVKAVVCVIGAPGARYSLGGAAPTAEEAPAEAPAAPAAAVAVTAPAAAPAEGRLRISPRAKGMAERKGIDARYANGTGPHGRIIERDIEAMLQTGPFLTGAARPFATGAEQGTGLCGAVTTADLGTKAPAEEKAAPAATAAPAAPAAAAAPEFEVVKNTRLRKIIAKNMHDSLANMAQLTHNSFADVTAMQRLRARIKAEGEKAGLPNITLNDMVIFAVSRTILEFPYLNAHYSDDEMKIFKHANLGVAVDTDRGLLVPTIMHADEMSLAEISLTMKQLVKECQSGAIAPEKLSGASFTISNLGAFGVTTFTPIINPPQTGILGVCNIETRIRMKDGQPEFYPTMNLSLTYDHRAMDGAPASRFLQTLARNIANIDLLMVK